MASYTVAQLRTVGIPPATLNTASTPGFTILDWTFDGSKRSTTSSDVLAFFDLPALEGIAVFSAGITVVKPGASGANVDLKAGGSNITGLTGWDLDAAAGTKLLKTATSGPLVTINTTASVLEAELDTGAMSNGIFRLRMWCILLAAPTA